MTPVLGDPPDPVPRGWRPLGAGTRSLYTELFPLTPVPGTFWGAPVWVVRVIGILVPELRKDVCLHPSLGGLRVDAPLHLLDCPV